MKKNTLVQKKHLKLDNLAKLVFWSIYHKRLEVLQNCLAFFVSFSGQRKSQRIERNFLLKNSAYDNSFFIIFVKKASFEEKSSSYVLQL
jgi:hypothetical protein